MCQYATDCGVRKVKTFMHLVQNADPAAVTDSIEELSSGPNTFSTAPQPRNWRLGPAPARYGADPSPFLKNNIEQLTLGHIGNYLAAPNLELLELCYVVYSKNPTKPYSQLTQQNNVSIITGLAGAGMTLAFGAAERVPTAQT